MIHKQFWLDLRYTLLLLISKICHSISMMANSPSLKAISNPGAKPWCSNPKTSSSKPHENISALSEKLSASANARRQMKSNALKQRKAR